MVYHYPLASSLSTIIICLVENKLWSIMALPPYVFWLKAEILYAFIMRITCIDLGLEKMPTFKF